MSKGLLALGTNEFFELKNKLVIGKGSDCEISLEGELADKQVQIMFTDNEAFIKNLNTTLPILVNKKILPANFYLPLLHLSLIELGEIQFIYSEEGTPRPFQIKKILQDFNLVEGSEYDKTLIEKATQIQHKINEITQKVKPIITEMEKIKAEISILVKKRDEKLKELNAMILEQTKGFETSIKEKKSKFDQLKTDSSSEFEEINKMKLEVKKILKDAAVAKASTILELDK